MGYLTMTDHEHPRILQPARPVGIIGYGAYVPRYRILDAEISRIWVGTARGGPVKEKAVPGLDEDVVTMSIEAARNALSRAQIDPQQLRAVWVGSESHPYSVKPTSTIVAEAIGAVPSVQAADWEFACKAGTEAMVAAVAMVGSNMADYTLAIGMDTAQGRPGDELEYTAAAGGAAYILGPAEESLAIMEGILLIRDRYAGFLAPGGSALSRTWATVYRRTGLFQTYHLRSQLSDGGSRAHPQGLPVLRLPPAQYQIPAAGSQSAGVHARAKQGGPALPGDRQHLCRSGDDRPDRDPG